MPVPTADASEYRACAAVALFNFHGKVWMGRRAGTPEKTAWQLPQGGIDTGETPEFAAIRELEEETGASVNLISPLGKIDDWLYYDIPGGSRRDKTVARAYERGLPKRTNDKNRRQKCYAVCSDYRHGQFYWLWHYDPGFAGPPKGTHRPAKQ